MVGGGGTVVGGGGGGTVVGGLVVGGAVVGGGSAVEWAAGVGFGDVALESDVRPSPRATAPAASATMTPMMMRGRLVTVCLSLHVVNCCNLSCGDLDYFSRGLALKQAPVPCSIAGFRSVYGRRGERVH